MSGLQKQFWIGFDGEPLTGTPPPRMTVYGPPLTREQEGGVNHAYRLFCIANQVALGEYQVRNRTLPDGTKIRMTSTNGRDHVEVWTLGEVEDQGLVGGFAFRQWAHSTPSAHPSRLGLKYVMANGKGERDRVKFYKKADDKYGRANWYGGSVLRTLSWDASSIRLRVMGFSNPSTMTFHDTAEPTSGYAKAFSFGVSTKIYHKSRVVLDLADPNLIDESGAEFEIPEGELANSTVQGCAISGNFLYVIVATSLIGEFAGVRDWLDFGYFSSKINYSIRVLQFPCRFQTINGRTALFVGKRFSVRYHINDDWMQGQRAAIVTKGEEKYDDPSVFVVSYAGHLLNGFSTLHPVQCWSFNASGTKAVCLFHEADFVEDVHAVFEYDVLANEVSVKDAWPSMNKQSATPSEAWYRFPGVGMARETAWSSSQTVAGTDYPPSLDELTYIRVESSGGHSGPDAEDFPFLLYAGYDREDYVTAEIFISDFLETSHRITEVSRAPASPESSELTTSNYGRSVQISSRLIVDMVFRRNGEETSRFKWYEYDGSKTTARNLMKTFVTSDDPKKSWPYRVLYIDAASQSVAWIEARMSEHYLAEYDTPLFSDGFPGGGIAFKKYDIFPEKATLNYVLRVVHNGVEQTEVMLRSEERVFTGDLAQGTVVTEFSLSNTTYSNSSDSGPGTGWYWESMEGGLFFSDYWVVARPYMFDSTDDFGRDIIAHGECGSAYGSTATYGDVVFSSIHPSQLEEVPILVLPGNTLAPPTSVTIPDKEPIVLSNHPTLLETKGVADFNGAWLDKISIF